MLLYFFRLVMILNSQSPPMHIADRDTVLVAKQQCLQDEKTLHVTSICNKQCMYQVTVKSSKDINQLSVIFD